MPACIRSLQDQDVRNTESSCVDCSGNAWNLIQMRDWGDAARIAFDQTAKTWDSGGHESRMAAGRYFAMTFAAPSSSVGKIRNPTPMGRVGPVVLICEPSTRDVALSNSEDNNSISPSEPMKPSPPAIVTAAASRDPAK